MGKGGRRPVLGGCSCVLCDSCFCVAIARGCPPLLAWKPAGASLYKACCSPPAQYRPIWARCQAACCGRRRAGSGQAVGRRRQGGRQAQTRLLAGLWQACGRPGKQHENSEPSRAWTPESCTLRIGWVPGQTSRSETEKGIECGVMRVGVCQQPQSPPKAPPKSFQGEDCRERPPALEASTGSPCGQTPAGEAEPTLPRRLAARVRSQR